MRQTGRLPRNGYRAQDHGDSRVQEDPRRELLKEAAVALSFGKRVPGGVATQRRAGLVCR